MRRAGARSNYVEVAGEHARQCAYALPTMVPNAKPQRIRFARAAQAVGLAARLVNGEHDHLTGQGACSCG